MAYLDEGGALVGEARGRLPVAARFGEVLPVGGQPEQTRPPAWRLDLPRLRAAAARQHLVARVARQREQHAEALEQEPAVRRVRVLRMFQSDPIRSDPIRPIRSDICCSEPSITPETAQQYSTPPRNSPSSIPYRRELRE